MKNIITRDGNRLSGKVKSFVTLNAKRITNKGTWFCSRSNLVLLQGRVDE
jgi:hypothetical protein